MEIECRKNIHDLHVFIERWLRGSLEKSRLKFQYFADALDEDFVIIHPDGECQIKSEIVNGLWDAHGAESENFTIEIRDTQFCVAAKNICVLTYEEWQAGTEESVRISTVVFKKSEHNSKCCWLHLHETWRQTENL